MKKFLENDILVGDIITKAVSAATTSLLISFVINLSTSVYHIHQTLMIIISTIFIAILSKHPTIKNISFKHYPKFLAIEGFVNLIMAVLTIILDSPMVYVVVTILMRPFRVLQNYGNLELINKTYNKEDERLEYDRKNTEWQNHAQLIGLVLGIALNKFLTGNQAFILLCISEIINNVFYYKAYKKIRHTNWYLIAS